MTQLENENGPRDPLDDTLKNKSANRALNRAKYGAKLFRAHGAEDKVQGEMDKAEQDAKSDVLDTQRNMIEGAIKDPKYVEGLEDLRREISDIQGNDGPMTEKTEAILRSKKNDNPDKDNLDPDNLNSVGNL